MIINIETFLILGGTKQDLKREVICQCWATGGQRQMAARTPAWAWGAHHRAAAGGANHDSVPRGACHRAHATVPCVRCPTGPASGARTRPASLGVGPSPRRRLAKIACSLLLSCRFRTFTPLKSKHYHGKLCVATSLFFRLLHGIMGFPNLLVYLSPV